MSTRTITVFESAFDQNTLAGYNYNLNIAKRVISGGGQATSNVVWKSLALAPNMTVSWDVKYALNWTAQVPVQGATVSIGGNWQPCDKGQSYDINNLGQWVTSANPATADAAYLNVGNVGYQYPSVMTGLHIIVGVLNSATQQYETIYVDPVGLPVNSTAKYQPLESVDLWYSADLRSSAFNIGRKSQAGNIDTTSPTGKGKFEWWATFKFAQGTWGVSDSPPPQTLLALPPFINDEQEPQPMALIAFEKAKQAIFFALPIVGYAAQKKLTDYLTNIYKSTKKTTFIWEGQDGKVLTISFSQPGPNAAGGNDAGAGFIVAIGGVEGGLDGALQQALSAGVLPAGETWTID